MASWWNIPVEPSTLKAAGMSVEEWEIACRLLVSLNALSFVLGAFVFLSYLVFKRKFPSRLIIYFR